MSDNEIVWALQTGDLDEVKAKLLTGDDVNRPLNTGRTPLHYAADFGHAEVLFYLISKGANINAKDRHGITPLMYASFENNIACVKILVEKGADKSVKTEEGLSALEGTDCEAIRAMLQ